LFIVYVTLPPGIGPIAVGNKYIYIYNKLKDENIQPTFSDFTNWMHEAFSESMNEALLNQGGKGSFKQHQLQGPVNFQSFEVRVYLS
jgi:hypothetical protein